MHEIVSWNALAPQWIFHKLHSHIFCRSRRCLVCLKSHIRNHEWSCPFSLFELKNPPQYIRIHNPITKKIQFIHCLVTNISQLSSEPLNSPPNGELRIDAIISQQSKNNNWFNSFSKTFLYFFIFSFNFSIIFEFFNLIDFLSFLVIIQILIKKPWIKFHLTRWEYLIKW